MVQLGNFQVHLRRPIVLVGPESHDLTYRLGRIPRLLPVRIPAGYRQKQYGIEENEPMRKLLGECDFRFSPGRLVEALALCIPGGIHLVEHRQTGRLVSMMMSRHLSSPHFPFGGRIDWLATSPAHRGRGLGLAVASLATNHLLERGYRNIWVTTQPSRRAAIRIFTSLGFLPASDLSQPQPSGKVVNRISRA